MLTATLYEETLFSYPENNSYVCTLYFKPDFSRILWHSATCSATEGSPVPIGTRQKSELIVENVLGIKKHRVIPATAYRSGILYEMVDNE